MTFAESIAPHELAKEAMLFSLGATPVMYLPERSIPSVPIRIETLPESQTVKAYYDCFTSRGEIGRKRRKMRGYRRK